MEPISLNDLSARLLAEISKPPSKLYVRGNSDLLAGPAIAIVGSRRPSNYGIRAATLFGRELSRAGLTVVSGLARGIDAAAHRGALAQCGRTIAVLGHGLDRIYPPENYALAELILENGGCLVSEYEPGTTPYPSHFPARNRIIAGLALGTLVIEAAEKSGSLITARLALEAGREVFAVPGGFDDRGYSGAHRLIQWGAKLVTTPAEVIEELPQWALRLDPTKQNEEGEDFEKIRHWFAGRGSEISLDELLRHSAATRDELLCLIERGMQRGWITELSFQNYGWIGQ